jgi:mono/diheme cytochrome c family protein
VILKMNRICVLITTGFILTGSLVVTTALPLASQSRKKPSHQKPAVNASKPGSEMMALGKKVYDTHGCATCHAIAGKGGNSGPELTHTGSVPTHTPQWLAAQVANPKSHNPDSTMPPFAQSIKGKDLTAIGAYLAGLKEPASGSTGTAATVRKTGAGPDSTAAAKIEQMGGHIGTLAQNDDHLEVSFHLAGAAVTDASLSTLKGLKNVVHLDLGQTGITDAGLASLKGMTGLTELHLEGTKITDAGLASLSGMKDLTYLNLYGTSITDAGLERLSRLTNLKHLYVWQTKVTEEGVNKLKKALPNLEVVQGWEPAPKK